MSCLSFDAIGTGTMTIQLLLVLKVKVQQKLRGSDYTVEATVGRQLPLWEGTGVAPDSTFILAQTRGV